LKVVSQEFFERSWEVATPEISLQRAIEDANILNYKINSIEIQKEGKNLLGIVKNQRTEYLRSNPALEEWYKFENGKVKRIYTKTINVTSDEKFIKTREGWKYLSGSLLDFYEKNYFT